MGHKRINNISITDLFFILDIRISLSCFFFNYLNGYFFQASYNKIYIQCMEVINLIILGLYVHFIIN